MLRELNMLWFEITRNPSCYFEQKDAAKINQ